VYEDVAPLRSGDGRLGALHAHGPAADVEWRMAGGRFSSRRVALRLGYELSRVVYEQLGPRTATGHIATGGLAAGF
jgi:hypothetical protein